MKNTQLNSFRILIVAKTGILSLPKGLGVYANGRMRGGKAARKAEKLAFGNDLHEMKLFVKKIETNHQLFNKKMSFVLIAPLIFYCATREKARDGRPRRPERSSKKQYNF